MKLNFKKAGARILLVVFFSSLLIISCEKDDEFVQPDAKTKNQEFFKHQKTGGDEFKSYILECLAQADDSLSFTGDFVKTYGLPQWDSGMHFGNEEYNSLIIPIYDQKNKAISALYYLHYQNQYIKSYILMNDEDDAAYEYSKRLIQYFEKTLNLETSNKEFDLIILENNNSQTKSVKSNIAIDYLICDTYWYKASTTDFTYYWSEEDCFISTEYLFQEHHSSGDWASSNGGNYSTNSPYGGGSSGSSNSTLTEPYPTPAPEKPIYSVVEYLDCIDPSLPVTLTIYVDQPLANSTYTVFTSVGHTFVGLTQGNNTAILGFYPKNGAKPTMELDFSILGNDSNTAYDVSITKEITTGQVNAILYYIENYPKKYQLSTFNCTDFGINVAKLGGLNLPDTSSKWLGGEGSNPGSLGQDIRNMQLPNGVNRNLNGGISPFNNKSCN